MAERISRRDFLKTALLATGSIAADRTPLLRNKEQEMPEPLTDLPVLWTRNAPVYIEHRGFSGGRIDHTIPENAIYAPEWISLSDMPLDILPLVRPETNLEVPEEFNPLGPISWVSDLPHITSWLPSRAKIIVGYGNPPRYIPTRLNGSLVNKDKDIVSTYAFTDHVRIYPTKIYNILTALACIADWQEENGPMMPGETHSYLVMTGAPSRNRDEYMKMRGYLEAAGICAVATTVSKAVFLATAGGYTEEVMRFMHQERFRYAENPFDPAITKLNSDATVEFLPARRDDYPLNADFRFRLLEDSPSLWWNIRAQLKMDEKPLNPKAVSRHKTWPADARATFSVSLVKSDPGPQSESLFALRQNYADFHNFEDGFLDKK